NPFERIEEARNRAIEGTGLGMSIVKRLLAAMGTHLEVESVYGKGSSFTFHVAQKVRDWKGIGNYEETRAKGLSKDYAYREAFQAPDAKILVVDDTPVNLTVMKGLLKQTRIQIECAEDGIVALEKMKDHKYDIIFIDHRMPKMDGMEMIKVLRSDEGNPNKDSVCIALTANVTGDVQKEYIDAGFEDYLSKPVDPKMLEAIIERYLPFSLIVHEEDPAWQDCPKSSQKQTDVQAEAPAGMDMDRMLLDATAAFFKNRFGLDISTAMMNCGNEEVFQDVVTVFHDTIDGKAADIERFAADGNWQDYTVQVHALKSSARLIGATELSNKAAALETAGNRARDGGDEDAVTSIRKGTPDLISDYRSFRDRLAPLCMAAQGTE
ncbi:MAG: response regulator, partial [Treponema sp.]|nr:response regulator [Treponema sp.]